MEKKCKKKMGKIMEEEDGESRKRTWSKEVQQTWESQEFEKSWRGSKVNGKFSWIGLDRRKSILPEKKRFLPYFNFLIKWKHVSYSLSLSPSLSLSLSLCVFIYHSFLLPAIFLPFLSMLKLSLVPLSSLVPIPIWTIHFRSHFALPFNPSTT